MFLYLHFQYCIKCFQITAQQSTTNLPPVVIFHCCVTSFFLLVMAAWHIFCYVYDIFRIFWCDQNFAHNLFWVHLHFQYCIECFWISRQHSIRNLPPIVVFCWCTTLFSLALINSMTYFWYVYDIFHDFWCDQNFARNFFLTHLHFQYYIEC